ncbi:MAG TPA: general secretion pathway protein GspB [Pseudomonadales bacterium]|nr:general secretion pathway protein GspB [Pseudomonadales bacterium]
MSYILDALKKSEEERRRGNLPDFTTQNIKIPKQRTANIWPFIGVAMLVVNMAVVGWLFLREPQKKAPEAAGEAEVKPVQAKEASTPTAAVVQTAPVVAQPPAQVIQQAPVQAMPQQVIVVPAGAVAPGQVVAIPQTVPAQSLGGQPVVVYAPAAQPMQVAPATHQVYAPGDPAPVQVAPNSPPSTVFIAPGQGDISSPNAEIDDKSVPDINELPDTIKRGLPELSFSSHMYSSDPAFRKVIINGKQLRENQPLNVDIILKRITEDGVVLDYQGTLFKVNVVEQWSYQN